MHIFQQSCRNNDIPRTVSRPPIKKSTQITSLVMQMSWWGLVGLKLFTWKAFFFFSLMFLMGCKVKWNTLTLRWNIQTAYTGTPACSQVAGCQRADVGQLSCSRCWWHYRRNQQLTKLLLQSEVKISAEKPRGTLLPPAVTCLVYQHNDKIRQCFLGVGQVCS